MEITEITEFYKKRFKHYGYDERDSNFNQLAAFNAHYYTGTATKGLLLTGSTGTGKTMFLGTMKKMHKVKIYTSDKIVQMFKNDENNCMEVLTRRQNGWTDGKEYDISIDDLGTEEKAVIYGERKEILEHILYARYDLWKTNGAKTFVSANLTEQALMERYGERVYSRLCEMCNKFNIVGEDWRTHRYANEDRPPRKDING